MGRATEGGDDQVPDTGLVARLLREHVPELASERVRPSATSGSSNWVFRVGEKYAVRLPRTDAYAEDLLKEARWVPRLAPGLPVAVPDVIHRGEPSAMFSRPWTVVTWVPGGTVGDLDPSQEFTLAGDLGRFVGRLHALDTEEQQPGPEQWGYRCGEPVTATIDDWIDGAAEGLADVYDSRRLRHAWRKIRDVPPASAPRCWVHTDLSAENLLVGPDGRLTGVVDFGGVGVGDRSVDLLYAWSLFGDAARDELRSASQADDTTWLRARAWAFAGPGLVTIVDYRRSMPTRTARLMRMVEAVAAEVGVPLR